MYKRKGMIRKLYSEIWWNVTVTSLIGTHILVTSCNPDAKRLYDDLMRKRTYNKHIMPPANGSQLIVNVALRLSQLLDLVSFLLQFFDLVSWISNYLTL
jgi:hypothetical protein